MTRIFISHRHSDEPIASALVDFLLAALDLRPDDIRCTSLPGHQLPFGTSISEQLKLDLKVTTGLIALITKDSLRSTWVLFELGSGWSTNKLVIPILGPGLSYDDLPGPLKQYPGVRIEDDNPSYRMTDAINQLASSLEIPSETSSRKDFKLNEFITKFRDWKPQLKEPESSQQEVIEQLTKKLEDRENAHNKQLQEIESTYQLQKQELVEAQQKETQDIKQSYQSQRQKLEQSLKSKIKQLEEQLEAGQAQGTKVAAKLQLTQQELSNKELIINQLQQQINDRKNLPRSTKITEIELKSEKGVDYSKLRDLLIARRWKEADQETANVMLTAANCVSQGYLGVEDIDNFPCDDLRTIDQLWVHYSNGKFGFSVQKKIYVDELGGTRGYNEKLWYEFGDRVGWRTKGLFGIGKEWKGYDDLIFDLLETTPIGHLPWVRGLWARGRWRVEIRMWKLFRKGKGYALLQRLGI